MKRLSLVAVLAAVGLSGCVVAPVGHGYYRQRPVMVAPGPVVVPPPAVIVRPGYDRRGYGYGYDRRGYDRRGHDGRGDGRRWRDDD